ncbi:uncharacterized protein [Panulirus ornatus]|uniref:uncharacterized protein isoform X2 n=1 Tax=Panulirus ornatus TaxID=150431 RepID=UPI003A89B73D
MCEAEEDLDGMGRCWWRWKQWRWRRQQWSGFWKRLGVAFILLLVCSLPTALGHIPVAAGEEMRIEATPVLVLAGPSSSQVVGFLRFPLEGSGGGEPGRREARTAGDEGLTRVKREYSLEDFLMWMPSGDGPTEEWKHRPRDTSWMRGDVITTTVFLTTTVYTTIFQPPLLTPATLTPSAVTATNVLYTKSPGNFHPSAVNPNRTPDRGGGKELGEGSVTTSDNDGVNPNCDNHTNPLDRPQSDYPQSGNDGNRVPDTSRDKDKSTQHKGDKTNYITVTRTITTPPPTLHLTNPPVLTTTTTTGSTQAEYDITDLVQPSVEYPGPSATITASSATPSLSSTVPLGPPLATIPSMGETVITTMLSPSGTYGHNVPTTTTTLTGGPNEGHIEEVLGSSHMLEPTVTTNPPESTEISSNNEYLTQDTATSPTMTNSGGVSTPSGAGGTPERPVDVTLTDLGVAVLEGETTAAEKAGLPDSKTTEATVDDVVDQEPETNLRDPVIEETTESSGNDAVKQADTEPGHDVAVTEGKTDASTDHPNGGVGEASPDVSVEDPTAETNLNVYINKGTTETSITVPVSEEPTEIIWDVSPGGLRNTTGVHLNVSTSGGPEPTDIPGMDYTHDFIEDVASPGLQTTTDLAHASTSDTVRPLTEGNSTVEHEIELFSPTTPPSGLFTPVSDFTTPASGLTSPVSDQTTSTSGWKTPVSDPTGPASDLTTPASLTTASDLRTLVSDLTAPASNLTTPSSNLTTPASNFTTPTSNLTTPTSDLTTPVTDQTTPASELATPVTDQTTPVSDLATPVTDQTTPVIDQTTPASDRTTPVTDQTTPASDLATPPTDQTTPVSDLATPVTDQTTPASDLTTTASDQTTPVSDLATPVSDLATPVTDQTTPVSDLATPVTDQTTPVSDLTTTASDHDYVLFGGTDTWEEADDGNGTKNGTFGLDFPKSNGSGILFNVSETGNGTQQPHQDIDGDTGSTEGIYSLPPTVPDHESNTTPSAEETLSPSLPEFGTTTEGVEAVDPSPEGLGDRDVDAMNSTDSVPVWQDTSDQTPTSDSPFLTLLWDDDHNMSTSFPYSSTEDSSSREPIESDFPLSNSSKVHGGSSDFYPTSEPVSSLPTEHGNGSAIFSPSKTVTPLSSSGIEASMSVVSLPVKPSHVTSPITVMPTMLDPSTDPPHDTYSTTTLPAGGPDVLDPSSSRPSSTHSTTLPAGGPEGMDSSPYPPDNSFSTTSTATGVPEVLSTPEGTQDSSPGGYVPGRDSDTRGSVYLTSADTLVTETVYESSVAPFSPEPPPVEVMEVSPTLESSRETSTETQETSPETYQTSLPTTEPDVIDPLSTLDEEITQVPYGVSETPSSTDDDMTVSSLTSVPSTSTITAPVFVTLFSTSSQKPHITLTPSTTTLPPVHTSAGSTTVSSSTTKESLLTSPRGTIPATPLSTEQTTGPQPSPPSPSNNATVPLDQRYWVRTVLEGPPKESNSQLYWSKVEAALTEIYMTAYERNLARQRDVDAREMELHKAPDRELTITLVGTESPSSTTRDPFENYTTIIARVRRDVMDPLNIPTQPTRRLLTGYDTPTLPARYKTAPALLRKKVLIPLHLMIAGSEKPAKRENKKALLKMKPWYIARSLNRRKRWVEWHAQHKSTHESKLLDEPRPLHSQGHVLRKRTVAKDVKVRLHNVTYDNNTDLTELVYTVFDVEEPILAREAVQNMSTVNDMEMAVVLDQVVVVKAEEYLQGREPARESNLVYAVIGGVVGGVMLLVFLVWLSIFLCKRHKRSREELQPDSEAASPRSQLSANAYAGHVNLAFATGRDEKVDASPLPSTSHALEDHLEQASPASSHDSLISKPKQGPLLGSSNARSRRHIRHRQEEANERSQDDSPEEEEDDDTSDEEVPDGRRPKSSVPWRRPSQRLNRTSVEEPVYSSPNPAHIQYQPSHSTYSKYDTTHSELTSSDTRYGPTHQLMANMLQSANSFTHKDEGSVFLPPPLLPPPQGFGKAHESPFIPGTSLPRFLPPPRLPKQMSPPKIPDGLGHGTPSRIQAYDYDPEAPPIPPRNYTREESGLPPLGHGVTSPTRAQMKDAQVEAHMESDGNGSSGSGELQERTRRPSASSSHVSDSGGSEGSMPNIGRLRRRFHDLLDDAFSLLNGQRPGDKVTPLTTPSPPRKGRSRSAAVQNKNYTHEALQEEDSGGRPWSAAAVHTSPSAWRDNQVVGVVPLDEGRSPKSAWGDGVGRVGPVRIGSGHSGGRPGSGRPGSGRPGSGRPGSGRSARSITPVNLPPTSPDRVDGGRPSPGYAGGHARLDEPVDPDTGLRASDPAVPLIRAIKDELRRFKSTISTESSSA